jgi:hypothetical protein
MFEPDGLTEEDKQKRLYEEYCQAGLKAAKEDSRFKTDHEGGEDQHLPAV